MARTHRLFDLLQVLRQHRQPVSGAELAKATGISLRTLYRDIATLQAMGAEIEGEPGVGYVLRPGFLLPPLMFSIDEIEALALGAQWVGRRTDDSLSTAARSAMAKIAAVLPMDTRRHLDLGNDMLLVGPGQERRQGVELKVLRKALREELKISLVYRDEKGDRTERIIWPVALGFFETTRVLVAWCEMRADFRHFRTDRIESATILDSHPPRRRQALLREWRQSILTKPDSRPTYTAAQPGTERKSIMKPELVFYTNPQSRGSVVHWILEEIGEPYTVVALEFGAAMKSPEYLAINPMGKVPAIRHGDTVVTETAAILAYLADAFPAAGLAPATASRGDYYRWMFFTAGCVETAVMNHAVGWDPSTPELQGRFGYGSYEAVLDVLAKALAGRRYIAGDTFTAADIHVGSMLGWGMQYGLIDRRPEFEAYWNGLKDRPAAVRAREHAAQIAVQTGA